MRDIFVSSSIGSIDADPSLELKVLMDLIIATARRLWNVLMVLVTGQADERG